MVMTGIFFNSAENLFNARISLRTRFSNNGEEFGYQSRIQVAAQNAVDRSDLQNTYLSKVSQAPGGSVGGKNIS